MTDLRQSVVGLTRPLLAKRAPKLPLCPDEVWLDIEDRFVVVSIHDDKCDLRFLAPGKAGLGVTYGVMNIPRHLVTIIEPLAPNTRMCPVCQAQRNIRWFKSGQQMCSICRRKQTENVVDDDTPGE